MTVQFQVAVVAVLVPVLTGQIVPGPSNNDEGSLIERASQACERPVQPVMPAPRGMFHRIAEPDEKGNWLRPCPDSECFEVADCLGGETFDGNFFPDKLCRVITQGCGDDGQSADGCLLLRDGPCDERVPSSSTRPPIQSKPPSATPTADPTADPTVTPTMSPSGSPTAQPTAVPSPPTRPPVVTRPPIDTPPPIGLPPIGLPPIGLPPIGTRPPNSRPPIQTAPPIGLPPIGLPPISTRPPNSPMSTRSPSAESPTPCDGAVKPIWGIRGVRVQITNDRGYWLRPIRCDSQTCYERAPCHGSSANATDLTSSSIRNNFFGDRRCRVDVGPCYLMDIAHDNTPGSGGDVDAISLRPCIDYRPCSSATTTAPTTRPPSPPTPRPTLLPCDGAVWPHWNSHGLRAQVTNSNGWFLRPCPGVRHCYEPTRCHGRLTRAASYRGNWFGDAKCRVMHGGFDMRHTAANGTYETHRPQEEGCVDFIPCLPPHTKSPSSPPNPCICPDVWDPVCVGGVTYSNACEARCAGHHDWTDGACTTTLAPVTAPTSCICPAIYRPVCVGGVTYSNACEARCAGHLDWSNGPCEPPTPPPTYCPCPEIYRPVCAAGTTFPNSCFARCAGHSLWVDGPCRTQAPVTAPTRPPTTCPPDTPPVLCVARPCDVSPCPAAPAGSTCVDNYCGGCHAEWYGPDGQRINECHPTTTLPSSTPPPTPCPPGTPIVHCVAEPCSVSPCPLAPSGSYCVNNYCGGCNAEWYTADGRSIDQCTAAPTSPPSGCICPAVYDPVCVNGKTYGNPCAARCAGHMMWTRGPCKTRPPSPRPCEGAVRPVWSTEGRRVVVATGDGFWLRRCPNKRSCFDRVPCNTQSHHPSMQVGESNFFGDRRCRVLRGECSISLAVGVNDLTFAACLDFRPCYDPTEAPTWATLPPTPPPTRRTPAPTTCDGAVQPFWNVEGEHFEITDGPGVWLRPCPSAVERKCYLPAPCHGGWTADTMPTGAYVGNFFRDRRCRVRRGDCRVLLNSTNSIGVARRCLDFRPCRSTPSPTPHPTRRPTPEPTCPDPHTRPCDSAVRPFWSNYGRRAVVTTGRGYWLRPCPNARNCYEPAQCHGWHPDAASVPALPGNWFGDNRCRVLRGNCQVMLDVAGDNATFQTCVSYRPCENTPSPTPMTRPPTPVSPCDDAFKVRWSLRGQHVRVTSGWGIWLRPCADGSDRRCYVEMPCHGSWSTADMPRGTYSGNYFGDRRCRVLRDGCAIDMVDNVDANATNHTTFAACLEYRPCKDSTPPPTPTPTPRPTPNRPCDSAVQPRWSHEGMRVRVVNGAGWWLKPCPDSPQCYVPARCNSLQLAGASNWFGDRRCRLIQSGCRHVLNGSNSLTAAFHACLDVRPCVTKSPTHSVWTHAPTTHAPVTMAPTTVAPTTKPPYWIHHGLDIAHQGGQTSSVRTTVSPPSTVVRITAVPRPGATAPLTGQAAASRESENVGAQTTFVGAMVGIALLAVAVVFGVYTVVRARSTAPSPSVASAHDLQAVANLEWDEERGEMSV